MNKTQMKKLRKLVNDDRHRNFNIVEVEKREDGSDIAKFSASSVNPIYSWVDTEDYSGPGYEVLSHDPKDIDMERKDIMHFLLDHQQSGVDNNLGMIRKFTAKDGKVQAEAERNPHNPVATRVFEEIESGFRPGISVGFMRARMGVQDGIHEGLPLVKYKWAPYEVSSVLIPADQTVGVGRSVEDLIYRDLNVDVTNKQHRELVDELINEFRSKEVEESTEEETSDVNTDTTLIIDDDITRSAEATSEAESNQLLEENEMTEKIETPAPDTKVTVGTDMAAERTRSNAIYQLGKDDNQIALSIKAVSEGWSVDRMKAELHDVAKSGRQVDIVDQPNIDEVQANELDLRQAMFNFVKLGESSPVDELGRQVAKEHGIQTRKDSMYIPIYVPMKNARSWESRVLATSPSAQGGDLVGTEFAPLAPALFEGQVTTRVGVQFHDINNQMQIPRFDNNMPAAFVGEGSSISLSSGSFATDTATPHQVVAAVGMTPHLGMALDGTYSPVDAVLGNMVKSVKTVAERSFWSGSATAEPGGIVNNTSIGLTGAASGTLAAYADCWETLRNNSVMSYAPFVVSPDVFKYGLSKAGLSTGTDAPTLVADMTGVADAICGLGGVINSAHLPAATMVAGDWTQALFFTFGVIEVRSSDVQILSGNDVLIARMFVDNVLQEPSAFTAITGSVVIA